MLYLAKGYSEQNLSVRMQNAPVGGSDVGWSDGGGIFEPPVGFQRSQSDSAWSDP